ncbi:MAG: TonB-dependent receptor, partial [Ignavibacteria bacterium]
MKKISGILSFLICLGIPLAYPQTISSGSDSLFESLFESLSIGDILVTSNRVRTSALLSSNKVQVLNEAYISRLNGGKLSDALSFSDAVFIKDYGFNSGLKTISLNSTQSEHTLILLDGIKLNSQQNSQFDLGLLQLDEVSAKEISKGGASSLY